MHTYRISSVICNIAVDCAQLVAKQLVLLCWCCLWLALLLSCVSLNGCSWLGRINAMRFVFAYHQLTTVFSSGVTSACTCLMNEKFRVVW